MVDTLSQAQARKIILLSQLPFLSKGPDATLNVIKKLGYVQIDTISVIARAHHHTLWNRVNHYSPEHLEKLQKNCDIFEYWSHAAAYLPIADYRYCLPKMHHMKENEKKWHRDAIKIKRHVLSRINDEGPLQSKDFKDNHSQSNGWWDWKPAKRALELLFLQGEIMVRERKGFQKVFDLTERVLPDTINAISPTLEEYAYYLIFSFLNANGIGNESEFGYLRQGMRKIIKKVVIELVENKELIELFVDGKSYYSTPKHLNLLNQKTPRRSIRILSPFDNLVIQRKRLSTLFDYQYQLECYVPAKKRKYGYFCLPILWGSDFIGRVDIKADRKNKVLIINNLFIEKEMTTQGNLSQSLNSTLRQFAQFNGCKLIQGL